MSACSISMTIHRSRYYIGHVTAASLNADGHGFFLLAFLPFSSDVGAKFSPEAQSVLTRHVPLVLRKERRRCYLRSCAFTHQRLRVATDH
jgi:hypothetical protein